MSELAGPEPVFWPCCCHCDHDPGWTHQFGCVSCDNDAAAVAMGLRVEDDDREVYEPELYRGGSS